MIKCQAVVIVMTLYNKDTRDYLVNVCQIRKGLALGSFRVIWSNFTKVRARTDSALAYLVIS